MHMHIPERLRVDGLDRINDTTGDNAIEKDAQTQEKDDADRKQDHLVAPRLPASSASSPGR